jgi:excisionase family DNA binding protein
MSRKKPEDKIERDFYTFAETQEYLGVSHDTLYKLIKQGLPSHKIGHKRVFLKHELIKWIEEH